MNKYIIAVLMIITASVMYCSQPPLEKITWLDNIETAITEGHPILVEFFSPS